MSKYSSSALTPSKPVLECAPRSVMRPSARWRSEFEAPRGLLLLPTESPRPRKRRFQTSWHSGRCISGWKLSAHEAHSHRKQGMLNLLTQRMKAAQTDHGASKSSNVGMCVSVASLTQLRPPSVLSAPGPRPLSRRSNAPILAVPLSAAMLHLHVLGCAQPVRPPSLSCSRGTRGSRRARVSRRPSVASAVPPKRDDAGRPVDEAKAKQGWSLGAILSAGLLVSRRGLHVHLDDTCAIRHLQLF